MVSTIMLILSLVFTLAIIVHAVIGLFKGWKRCLLRLCRTVTAIILSFLVLFIISSTTSVGETFGGILSPLFQSIEVLSGAKTVQTLIGEIIASFTLPFIFTMTVFVFDLLLMIPAYFIGRALGIYKKKENKKDKDEKKEAAEEDAISEEHWEDEDVTAENHWEEGEKADEDHWKEDEKADDDEAEKDNKKDKEEKPKLTWMERFGGAGISAVTATLVLMVSLMPITGIIYTFMDGIDKVTQTAKKVEMNTVTVGETAINVDDTIEMIDSYVAPVRDNIYFRLSYCAPMRLIYHGVMGKNSNNIELGNEISQVFDLVANSLYLTVDLEDYGEDQKVAVSNIIGYVSKSDLHCQITYEILSSVASNALHESSDLTEGTTGIVTKPLLTFFANEGERRFEKENVKNTLNTVSNILCIMIDYDLPYQIAQILAEESDDITSVFANEEMLTDIFLELYHNKDFRFEILSPVIDFMFTTIVQSFDPEAEPLHLAEHENLSDADIRAEAKLLATVFSDLQMLMETLPQITESENALDAIATTDMTVIGRSLDNARKSVFLGEGIDIVFVTILKSSTFDSMRGVSDILIRHIESGEEISMESLMASLHDFAAILNSYENGNGSPADMAASLRSLSKNLSGNTKDIMIEIINDSGALDLGGMASTSDNNTTQKLLTTVITQLADSDMTDEEYEKEAKAIDYALQLVQASNNSEEGSGVQDIYNDEEGMTEMIETLSSSKIASATINVLAYETDENGDYVLDENGEKVKTEEAQQITDNMTEEDQETMISKMEEHYKAEAEGKTAEEMETMRENLTSLSTVFGIDISDSMAQWDADLFG